MKNKSVEIEFLMRDRFTSGVDKASKSVDGLGRKADTTTRKVDGISKGKKGIDGVGRSADTTSRKLEGMGKTAQTQGDNIQKVFNKIIAGGALVGGSMQIADISSTIIDVRGQRQLIEQSFEVLLGSKEKMKEMVGEIIELGINSPLEMNPIAKTAQTLLGFGVAAENVMPVLRQLSDVSMGNQQRFESLGLVYAKVQAAGKLMAEDFNTFIDAGFNPFKVMAEQTGKSMGQLKKEMSEGGITAKMVASAFASATSEGGQFHNMTEKQADGIIGVRATYEDSITAMQNEIGQANEEMIKDGYAMATSLVNNYENIGRALTVLIATYGTYRAALIVTAAVQKTKALADNIKLIMMFRKELGLLTAAQQAFNLKAMANPYVFLAAAIIGAGVAIWGFIDAKKEEEKAIAEALKPMRDELTQTNKLVNKLGDVNLKSSERKEILEELKKLNPEITKGVEDEAKAYEVLSSRLEEYNKVQLAEMAVEKFSLTEDLAESVQELDEANNDLQDKSADMIDIYATLFTRFKELEVSGAKIPDNLKSLFNSIIESSIPETEKVKALFVAYDAIQDKVKQARGAYTGRDWQVSQHLFRGLSTDEYEKEIKNLDEITKDYKEKVQDFKDKIESIASAIFTDDTQKQEFINSQILEHLPNEFKGIKKSVDDTTEATRTWKTELLELVDDDYKPKIEATTNVPEVLAVIQKSLKAEQDRVDSMKPLLLKAGFDFSAMSFPAGSTPSLLDQQWATEYTTAQTNLSGLNKVNSKIGGSASKKSGDVFTKNLQTQIDLTKSAKEEYKQLLKYMSSEDAFKALKSVNSYSSVKLEDIVDGDSTGYMSYLEEQISVLSTRKTEEAKTLATKLQKEFDGLKLGKVYESYSNSSEIEGINTEYEKQVIDQVTETQNNIRQASIDAMDEGFEKEMAQVAFNYDRLIAENKNREKEWLEELRKSELAKWQVENPDKDPSGFTKQYTVSDLSQGQQNALGGYATSANNQREQGERDVTQRLLEQYQTYADKRKAIEEQYNNDIESLRNDNADDSKDGNISEAQRLRDEALIALDTEIASRTTNFDSWANKMLNAGLKQLKSALKTAEATLESDGGTLSDNEKAKLRAQIAVLTSKIQKAENDKQFETSADKSNKKWGDTLEVMNEVNSTVENVIGEFDGLDSVTKNALSSATNIAGGIIGMIGGIQALAVTGATAIKGVEKASVILAVIGAAISIMSALFSLSSKADEEHQEALAAITEAKLSMQREYNKLLIEQLMIMRELENAFGEDQITKMAGYFKALSEAQKGLKEEMQGEAPTMNWIESATDDYFGTYQKRLDDYKKGILGIANIDIKTGSYTTGAWFWKKQHDVMSGITDVYYDLIDSENNLNIEKAKAILASHEMSDADRARLEAAIEYQEMMVEAREEMRGYISETFGELGEISNIIVDAFENGTDAKDAWADSFSASLKKLGVQLMQTLFFQKHFDKLEEDLLGIYEKNGDDPDAIGSGVTNLLADFFGNMGGVVDDASDWYAKFADMAKENGFDLSGDGGVSQTGQAGAFQTMDQETGSELKGLFTSLQMSNNSIDDRLAEINVTMYAVIDVLTEIAISTKGCNDKLGVVVDRLNEQKRDGLKMK